MRKTKVLEFKKTITNTFLKTVSAFSNYDDGAILFGVDLRSRIYISRKHTNGMMQQRS